MSLPSLPAENVKRAAALAVARYGADRTRVGMAYQATIQAQAQGISGDLVDMLVIQKLLTPVQAELLRLDLLEVLPDPIQAPAPTPVPGGQSRPNKQTPLPDEAAKAVPPTRSGYYLRSLGEFRLLRRLGEGGMGTVYLGYQEGQERQVAIKVLADQLANNQSYIVRFHREAKSGSLLDHPNIVHFVTAGKDRASGKHYLVMEFVDGPSVRALIDNFGHLSVGDAVHITIDVARALDHVHARNFVHRDIKPDNILLTQDGVAKLADLGLAKCISDASALTAPRKGFGTPYYMPCEQAIDATEADNRCDIYALGASLYHMVTGTVPFPGDTHVQIAEKKLIGVFPPASSLNTEVPSSLDRILGKMLARYPRDRYQSAAELIADLEQTNLDVPVPSFVERPKPKAGSSEEPVQQNSSQPTRPDLETPDKKTPAGQNGSTENWYIRYREATGQWCKTRASTRQIVARLASGQLPVTIEVSRKSQGTFQPASSVPEFREVLHPTTEPAAPEEDSNAIFLPGLLPQKQDENEGRLSPVATALLLLLLAGAAALAYYFLGQSP